jgi:hypothetical protein
MEFSLVFLEGAQLNGGGKWGCEVSRGLRLDRGGLGEDSFGSQ